MTFYVKIPIFIKTQGFLKPFQGEHFQEPWFCSYTWRRKMISSWTSKVCAIIASFDVRPCWPTNHRLFSRHRHQCLTSFFAFHADRDMKVKIPVWISACVHNRLPDHPFGRFQAASTCYFWITPWKFCCAHTAQADFIRLQIQFFCKLTWISREGLSLLMRAGSLQLQSQQL